MNFYCLQHVPFETPGILSDLLLERGHILHCIHLYRGDPLPRIENFDGLVIMGGPMSIHDENEHPWLPAERQLIATAIAENKKVLGICLGAQLIAAACGGRVYPNLHKEIGFWPVHWTEAAIQWTTTAPYQPPLNLRDLESQPLFHWHGETVDLPPGATLLASTAPCVNQAFRLGDHVLGLQFHPEVTPGIIRDMVTHEGHELIPAPYIQSAASILHQLHIDPAPPLSPTGPPGDKWHLDGRSLLNALLDPFLRP